MKRPDLITIAGAGLVGSLLGVMLGKRGYRVQIFERRADMRGQDVAVGRSINLALAGRAPAEVGGGAAKAEPGAGGEGGKAPLRAPSGALRIGKLTIEERRQRILRYRQKRHERNFKKRIKYACRKTLADSRPRIRGRFATNEEWDALKKKKAEEDAKKKAESKK